MSFLNSTLSLVVLNFLFLYLCLFSCVAGVSTPADIMAVRDSDPRRLRSTFEKRFPPISSDDAGSGPHVSRTVAKCIVVVVLISVFLIVSLLLLRKCRPTFPRNRRVTVFHPSSSPILSNFAPPAYDYKHERHSKRNSQLSMSDTSTVVANELDYLPSSPIPAEPPKTYAGRGKISVPAVGPTVLHSNR